MCALVYKANQTQVVVFLGGGGGLDGVYGIGEWSDMWNEIRAGTKVHWACEVRDFGLYFFLHSNAICNGRQDVLEQDQPQRETEKVEILLR